MSKAIAHALPRLLACLDLQEAQMPTPGAPDRPLAVRCAANCRRVLAFARSHGWNIAHIYRGDIDGPELRRPLEGLEPLPSEPVMHRTGLSAFSHPAFAELVDSASVTELVIVGFSLSSSCLATALAAYDRRIRTVLVADAVSATALDAVGLEAIGAIVRGVAAPFVRLLQTDAIIDPRPRLQVVRSD